MKLKDINGEPFREGGYINHNNDIYKVFQEGDQWLARGIDNGVYELATPMGMPDSERVPEGKLNVMYLKPLSKEMMKAMRNNIDEQVGELENKKDLLECLLE